MDPEFTATVFCPGTENSLATAGRSASVRHPFSTTLPDSPACHRHSTVIVFCAALSGPITGTTSVFHSYPCLSPFCLAILMQAVATAAVPLTEFADDESPETTQTEVWNTDFAAAQKRAETEHLPMMLHFSARWCGPCQQMVRNVLHAEAVTEELRSGIIPVLVDASRPGELTRRFGVRGYPTNLIISADGTVLSRQSGYIARESMIRRIRQFRIHPPAPATTGNSTPADIPAYRG